MRLKNPSWDGEKVRDRLRRATFIFIGVMFLVTGLGVGVVAFWQATHPPKDDSNQQALNQACQFQIAQNQPTLPLPEAFKPSGDVTKLETTDLQEGSGAPVKPGDCVTVKYYGTLATSGEVFDQVFDKPQALKFQLGTSQVIPGWDQGLVGMKADGLRRLVVPSDLAYGDQAQGPIPANSDLVFVVKLLGVQ